MPTHLVPRLNVSDDLYLQSLRDLIQAECAIGPLEERMAAEAASPALQRCLHEQHELSLKHLEWLETILAHLDQRSEGLPDAALRGLIKRVEACLTAQAGGSTHDIRLIALNRSVRHHQIALYGTALAHAMRYSDYDACRLLRAGLEEEQKMDRDLISLGDIQISQPRPATLHRTQTGVYERGLEEVQGMQVLAG